ncbi:MAG: c-type cytochrome, partial [Dehalococcoidia bacterium]|nr:c-type cytochrome [Dehalococcoidia bacterium]
WRCKECHGWDYAGKDGAYGSGSHKTGFVGVSGAASKKCQVELVAILKGASNPNHDFSKFMDDASIANLATFLKQGLVDNTQFIDYASKKPKGANAARGKDLYERSCAACHASDGTKLNFGTEAAPEFVGTLAQDNPQELLHKIRTGQPGEAMPSALVSGWSMQDVLDVMAHAQTLPKEKTPTILPTTLPTTLPATLPATLPKTGGPLDFVILLALVGIALAGTGTLVRGLSRR